MTKGIPRNKDRKEPVFDGSTRVLDNAGPARDPKTRSFSNPFSRWQDTLRLEEDFVLACVDSGISCLDALDGLYWTQYCEEPPDDMSYKRIILEDGLYMK